jgi:arsenical pump membrane protein
VLVVSVNAAICLLLFRHDLPRHFQVDRLPDIRPPLRTTDRVITWGLGLVALGYVAAALARLAPYWVTLVGGAALGLTALAGRRIAARDLLTVQPPSLYAFVVGLAVVVAAADEAGLLAALGWAVRQAAGSGGLAGLLGVTVGTALGTNLVNNWTMALAVLPPLERTGAGESLAFGSLLGADIGPNLSVVGSLATLIWLTEVRRGGLAVSGRAYLRLGIISTIPALLCAALALYLLERVT